MNKRTIGKEYEEIAKKYLESQGYKVLEQNWYAGNKGELDIICIQNNCLVFIEVKGRKSSYFGLKDALESISPQKGKNLRFSINKYLALAESQKMNYSSVRLDLVIVYGSNNRIEHLENIDIWS